MNDFSKFAMRFHKIKRDMQDAEEADYARLLQQRATIRSRWLVLSELEQTVRSQRANTVDTARWHSYDAYQRALGLEKVRLEAEWDSLQGHVSEQKQKLQRAYIEQEQWAHILENALFGERVERERKQQVETDEDALRLFERRMAHGGDTA